MASKSRLGKGLGALFPTLPGEEPVAEQPAMIAEDSSTPEATADITPAKKATAQQESKPAVPQTISSSKAVRKPPVNAHPCPHWTPLLILATCFSVRRNLKPVRSPHLSRAASRLRLRRHIVHPSLSKMFHVKHL